jgi:predicted small metal-binding protein
MTKVLRCKDIKGLNPKCPFEWRGDSEDEILYMAAEHVILWHKPKSVPDVLWKARNAIHEDEVHVQTAGGS